MKNFQCPCCSSIAILLLSLSTHGCHPSHLHARDEETAHSNTAGESTSVSKGTLSTPNRGLRTSPKYPVASTDTLGNEKTPDSGAASMLPSRKRPAEALFQDTEEKKESPTALEQPMSPATSVIPVRDIAASITQTAQESAAMAPSPAHAVAALAKTEQQDTVMAKAETKDITKKAADEEDQKLSADLIRWFKEFAEAVDDEEVLSLGETSEAIPRLVQEGKEKGYLNKSMKLVINEVGWEPDCTPLHYAAAKGNPQAVDALVREPEVVIDARTEENGTTPLQFAAYDGHLGAAESLISAYKSRSKIKDIDAPDRQGTSALQYAALGPRGGMNRGVAEFLVNQGADPTQLLNNKSPLLCLSSSAGNLAMVEYWIEEIAYTGRFSREQKKDFITRGIKLARHHKHMNIVTILRDHDTDL